jgi:hypothetical protein
MVKNHYTAQNANPEIQNPSRGRNYNYNNNNNSSSTNNNNNNNGDPQAGNNQTYGTHAKLKLGGPTKRSTKAHNLNRKPYLDPADLRVVKGPSRKREGAMRYKGPKDGPIKGGARKKTRKHKKESRESKKLRKSRKSRK